MDTELYRLLWKGRYFVNFASVRIIAIKGMDNYIEEGKIMNRIS